jgi:hypothetical protein
MDLTETPNTSKSSENDLDLYHRPSRLVRIASIANVVAWVSLAFAVFLFVSFIVFIYQAMGQGATFMGLLIYIILFVAIVLLGLFFFVLLQAISESIYLFMDIEENGRREE